MPAGLKRYHGKGDLHFLTFSCYQRLPLLKTKAAMTLFLAELARVSAKYRFRPVGYVLMPEDFTARICADFRATRQRVGRLTLYPRTGIIP